MRAAVLEKLNAPLTLAEVGLGSLEYGQVLVRVLASGICGAQLQEIAGHKGNARFLPHLLGHEGCGIVEEVGPGVLNVNPGEKVILHWRQGVGIESDFPRYVFRGETIRSGKVVTFAEKVIVSENRCTPVPLNTPPELCALLGCGLSTALATVENEAALRFGESVLIIGCGGLGANLIRACSMRCASPIVVADVIEAKCSLAYSLGADYFLNCAAEAWGTATEGGMKIDGFDLVLDTAGAPSSMEHALQLLRPSGRYVMIGQPRPGESVSIANANRMFEGDGKRICATQGGGFRPNLDIPRYLKLYRAGLLNIDKIITQRIPLEKINDGIDAVREGAAGRILVEMSNAK